MRRNILQGSTFEETIGYARAVVHGNTVYVAGTTGYDYDTMAISEDVVEQARQCLKNIAWALHEAGASFEDVVRVLYIFPDPEDFPKCHHIFRETFGTIRPAATMISAGLVSADMKVEIEVTAVKG